MGGSHSLPSIGNGYELVIRVSKELENALRIKLELPNTASNDDGNEDKDQGLTKMIGGARDLVCSETFAAMMRMAKIRNRLVHDETYATLDIGDRCFIEENYQRVAEDLSDSIQRQGYGYAIHRSCGNRLDANHFELVIRASKYLKVTLIKILNLKDESWKPCLSVMIEKVRDRFQPDVIKDMQSLSKIRNRIVHEYGFDELHQMVFEEIGRFLASMEQTQLNRTGVTEHRRSNHMTAERSSTMGGSHASTRESDVSYQMPSYGTTGHFVVADHGQHYRPQPEVDNSIAERPLWDQSSRTTGQLEHQIVCREPSQVADNGGIGLLLGAAVTVVVAGIAGITSLFQSRPVQRNFLKEEPTPKSALEDCCLVVIIAMGVTVSFVAATTGLTFFTVAKITALGIFILFCLACVCTEPLPVVCHNWHPAKRHRVGTRQTFFCSVCRMTFRNGVIMFGCQECNFDVCQACSKYWAWRMHSSGPRPNT